MRGVQAIVVLATLTLAVIFARMGATAHFDPKPILEGFTSPVVALELAKDAGQVERILRDPIGARNRAIMAGQVARDWAFIIAYWLAFAGLSVLQDRSGRALARRLAPSVLCAITMAATFDVLENLAILRILGCARPVLPESASLLPRHPSLVKWGFFFAASILASPLFLGRRGDRGLLRALAPLTGLLFLTAGALGIVGLAINPLIEAATAILAAGLLSVTILFLVFPKSSSPTARRPERRASRGLGAPPQCSSVPPLRAR